MSETPTKLDPAHPGDSSYAQRMALAYTDDYLRILGIEYYRLGYFDSDIAPDDLPAALERYTEVLLAPLNLGPNTTVLELGCNAGATTSWLVRRYGCTVYAIDIVEDMVRAAKQRFELERITDRAIASRMDARHLEFKDGMFDAVIGIEVLYHLTDKLTCLKDIARVLKPGGRLALAEYMLEPGGPKLGQNLIQRIVESDNLEGESQYRSYLAAAGLTPHSITDRYQQTVIGTNRAFMSERYKAKITAYAYIYFGAWFTLALPWVLKFWAYMFRQGHARHVFLHSQKQPA
jgi:cyclopropane fatty-acyl-phospholipid synthase-like methyltransferase